MDKTISHPPVITINKYVYVVWLPFPVMGGWWHCFTHTPMINSRFADPSTAGVIHCRSFEAALTDKPAKPGKQHLPLFGFCKRPRRTNRKTNTSTGWWLTYPSEKYELVSWGYDIPNWMESHKKNVPNHQPDPYIHELAITVAKHLITIFWKKKFVHVFST